MSREIPKIQASPAYNDNSTIIVTWDEGADPPFKPGNPLLLAIGAGVTPGVVSSGSYNHYGTLRTIETAFGLPLLGKAKTAKAGSCCSPARPASASRACLRPSRSG